VLILLSDLFCGHNLFTIMLKRPFCSLFNLMIGTYTHMDITGHLLCVK